MRSARLHALLIGIDRYGDDTQSKSDLYPNLEGAVLDVHRWAALLKSVGVPAEDCCQLTAPLDGGSERNVPTYDRIVEALEEIGWRARSGDDVFFVFSGHGGCVPTLLPELKGEDGIDEALIPAGMERPRARVLRDVEMAVILQRWTQCGLRVTLCFDCCHAGGTTRHRGIRGSGEVNTTLRPSTSLIADSETLAQVWREATRRRRDLKPASGWLPDPRGYVLFAACQAHERAVEGYFEALGPGGALTHALLGAIGDASTEVTCAQLHRQVLEQVQRWTEGQTPQIEGDRERTFWKGGRQVANASTEAKCRVEAILEQGDPSHYLNGALALSAYRVPPSFMPHFVDVEALRGWVKGEEALERPAVDGEWICLRLENRSNQPLFVALYLLTAGGEHKRLFPAVGVGEAELLRPGEWQVLPLRASLPEGVREVVETTEALAASDSELFRGKARAGVYWTVTVLELRIVARQP